MGATKEIVLSDGKKLTVDVSSLTVKEWRGFWNPGTKESDDDKVVARLCGLKARDIENLLRDDQRLILKTITELSNRPLDDPNLPSASISES